MDELGDYERFILDGDREQDPDGYRDRMLAAGDQARKYALEHGDDGWLLEEEVADA